MKKLPGKPVRKHNAGKALKISALFGIVVLLIIASVNFLNTKETTPDKEFVFTGGEDTGTTSEQTITYIQVTTLASPLKGGTVTSGRSIPSGTSIKLDALPADGYRFVGWKKGTAETYESTSASYVTPQLNENTTYTAVFELQSTVDVVPKTLMLSANNPYESTEGGTVFGGGTVGNYDSVTVNAVPSNSDLYEFNGWYKLARGGSIYEDLQVTSSTVSVGYKFGTIRLNPGDQLYAAFKRKSDKVIVTATMVPAIGNMMFSKTILTEPEATAFANNENKTASISTVFDMSTTLYLYFGAYSPKTYTSGSEDTEYVLTHVNYQNSQKTSFVDPSTTYAGLSLASFLPTDHIVGDTDIFVHYKGTDASFNNTCSVSTFAFPKEGGVTAGDMASTGAFTATIRATPNEGYSFDHWEWYDPESGQLMTSKEASLSMSVTGMVSCKAFFHRDGYSVNVASMTPGNGGYVLKGLGKYESNSSVEVEIKPYDGFEFKHVSYTTMDGITHTYESSNFTIDKIKEDIYLNIVFEQTKFNVSAKPDPVKSNDDQGFNKVSLTSGSIVLTTTDDGKAVELALNSQGSVTLEAIPSVEDGYRFVEWVGTDGTVSTANPFTPSSVTKDVTYIAKFDKEKYKIRVVADPAEYGDVFVGASATDLSSLGEYEVKAGDDAYIKAEAKTDYKFLYWTNSAGTRLTSPAITLEDIKNDEIYTAHFGGSVELTIEPSPSGYGQVQLENNGYVTTSTTYRVVPNQTITLYAKPLDNSSYKFVKWVGSDGKEVGDRSPTLTIQGGINSNSTYTAVFAENSFTIRTIADPENGGTANVYNISEPGHEDPGSDDGSVQQTESQIISGGTAKLIAVPASGYEFQYWTSSTGTRYYDATTVIPNVGNDEVFTAHFYKNTVQVTIDGTPAGYSVFKLDDKPYVSTKSTYPVPGNSSITLTAESVDASMYEFVAWEDNYGNTYQVNPLQITEITKDTTFTAIFNPKDQEIGIVLRASPANGGILTKEYKKDPDTGQITALIKAQANPGFVFSAWIQGELEYSKDSSCTVSVIKDGEVYTAVFKEDPNYKPTSDIPTQKYPDVSRTESSPSYTVTRETLTVKAKKQIDRAASRYKDYSGVPNSYSAYSSIIAETSGKYAEVNDRSALLLADEFITTQKQTVSSVPASLQSAEEYAAQFTKGKFGDRYKFEILTIKQVTADPNFASSEHTFLLKNTGAAFKDNVYILFGTPGGRGRNSGIQGFDWVTCFVDEAGTLRFTIPSFNTNDYFIVVRTWPE